MSLIVTAANAAFEQWVRSRLPRSSTDSVQRWEGPLEDTAAAAKAIADLGPAVVILGPQLSEETAFKLAGHFDRSYPTISVLLAGEPGPNTWQQALAAGVRAVITPDTTDDDLRSHLDQALEVARRRLEAAGAGPEPVRSRVITVISPKGGSGKTIVSTNLAVCLAARVPGEVVLVDLDLQFGDVAYALALSPQHTMSDAASAPDDLDATTLKLFLSRHQSGLYALCAPAEPGAGELISAAATTTIIRLIASQFSHVVIDTPAGLGEHTLAALEYSTDIVLISDMDVPSVRNLRKALDALDLLGMMSPSRHFVLNRADSRVGLNKDDVAAATGMAIDLEIPSSRYVPVSLNEGRPLVTSSPRSLVARRIAHLAERFVQAPVPAVRGSRGGGS
jgi:pilus assembly protein CpaE